MVNPQAAPGNARQSQRTQNYFVAAVDPYNRNRAPTTSDYRDPATGRLYPIHCEWRDTSASPPDIWKLVDISSNSATWQKFIEGGGTGDIMTLSGDDGVAVDPDASGNMNLNGLAVANATHAKPAYFKDATAANTVDLDIQVGAAVTGAPGDKNDAGIVSFDDTAFGVDTDGYVTMVGGKETACSNFIVDPSGTRAEYTTIQAAIDAASAGNIIFVKEGTYTEDLNIDKNLKFQAFSLKNRNGPNTPIITGKMNLNSTTIVEFTGFQFQTNSDNIVDLGSGNNLTFDNCRIKGESGVTSILSSAGSNLYMTNCSSDVDTGKFLDLQAGTVFIEYCFFENTSSTASTVSAGSVTMRYSSINTQFVTSGTGSIISFHCEFGTTFTPYQNLTWLTQNSSQPSYLFDSKLYSGTATAIDIDSGTVECYDSVFNSSNANVIDGAGTFKYGGLTFSGSSSNVNTTTQTLVEEGPNRIIGGTGYLQVPSGTTAQQPGSPVEGMIRYNTTAAYIEGYSNGAWKDLTASSGGGGLTWNEVTGTSQALAVDNGYICNNASLVTCTLPSTAAVGDVIRVVGSGSGGWRIAQNAGQTIHFGSNSTTTGTGGRLDSVNQYDGVEIICITANTDFIVISSQGTIQVT